MRVIHVIASVADEASGPSYSIPHLCAALAHIGDDVRLMSVGTSVDAHQEGFRHTILPQDYVTVPLVGRLRSSHRLAAELSRAAECADVLHGHGLWLMPNIYPASVASRSGKPLVISPRGMLQPQALAIGRFRKLAFWYVLQKRALEVATCLHATSPGEFAALRKFGLRQPVAIIPNGIDLPPRGVKTCNSEGRRTLLYFGRIHPIKNLESLIDAWSQLEARFPSWDLRVVGDGIENYVASLKMRAARAGVRRIEFTGPVYGNEKATVYGAADLYVLPSKSENFAMTVAEALAAGTPAITTKGTPWSAVVAEDCGWWIDHGVEALGATLAVAMAMPPPQLMAMGARGRDWMARSFTWESVAVSMHNVYEWLVGRGDRPANVEIR